MPYEVLTQKWRPQRFSDVVGQKHVITTLKNQLLNDRIGHAYLFSGPRGTGKTTVARILAKAVNCKNREIETEFSHEMSAEPCNKCNTCVAISNGSSFDVTEMDAASNRGIDEIRGLRERVKLAPSLCQYKVYIIDEAHMLTTEAFNALLKTLEEPPKHVIFILITTERHRILKTILSRCQDFEFGYISHSQITSHLKKLCESEGFYVTEEGLGLIAQKSEGCLRDSQNLLEQLFAASGENREVDIDDVSRLLGFGSVSLLNTLVEQIIDRNAPNCLEILNQLAEQGADLSQCLRTLITDFRNLRLLSVSLQLEEIIDASQTKLEHMKSQIENVSLEQIDKILKILIKTEGDIKRQGYELINFESALIDACSVQEGIKLVEAFDKLKEIQGMLEEMSQSPKTVVPSISAELTDVVHEIRSNSSVVESEELIEEGTKQLVYQVSESLSELESEEIINRLTNWLNESGYVDLTYNIQKNSEVKLNNSKLILKFSSDLWYNFAKEESSVIESALKEIANLSRIDKEQVDEHKDVVEDEFDYEDVTDDYRQENSLERFSQETSDVSDDDIPVIDYHDNRLSKHKLFTKAMQDKTISYALKKFKADLIDVKPN